MSDFLKAGMKRIKEEECLLWEILVSSIDGERDRFRTVSPFVLSEVINGTINYIGGKSGKVLYWNCRVPEFRRKIVDYFDMELVRQDDVLSSEIKNKLVSMTRLKLRPCPQDRHDFITSLDEYFQGNKTRPCSSYRLSSEFVDKVNEGIRRYHSFECIDVKRIGEETRGFIEDDLKFIAENYS